VSEILFLQQLHPIGGITLKHSYCIFFRGIADGVIQHTIGLYLTHKARMVMVALYLA